MKSKIPILTKEERDVLILAAAHPYSNRPCNNEIAQRLGISVGKVKRVMHNSFIKLGVHSRTGAIRSAQKRGEISLKEVYSLDELVEFFSAVGPELLRKIAYTLRQGQGYDHLLESKEEIIFTDRREDTILTNRERDVVIGVGNGLTNKEIADRLYISISAVATFLYRACRKLGASNRIDVFMLALHQREISLGESCSINDLLHILTHLGAETLEEMAQRMDKKPEHEPVPAESQ